MLAVDADNTLWGGIVGEDGADGITIGDSFPGNGYRALQQGLVYQAANGALVAMLSKNNGPDVDEVFDDAPATWCSPRTTSPPVGSTGTARPTTCAASPTS